MFWYYSRYQRTPFRKCVCEIRRNKMLELYNASLKKWLWEKAITVPDIEHDEANDIVVQGKSSLLWQLRNESDQSSQSLEDWNCIFSCKLLHEVFEEQVAVLDQASPDHLSSKKLVGMWYFCMGNRWHIRMTEQVFKVLGKLDERIIFGV